jgi:hypothetical protein
LSKIKELSLPSHAIYHSIYHFLSSRFFLYPDLHEVQVLRTMRFTDTKAETFFGRRHSSKCILPQFGTVQSKRTLNPLFGAAAAVPSYFLYIFTKAKLEQE